MNRCIVTPTYSKHFPYIEQYLKSFDRYLTDKGFPICFIVDRSDFADLKQIADRYSGKLNIQIIAYEDVLQSMGIDCSSADLLQKLGRLSFQTIKKYYSALYLGCEQFLVLDSESIMIRETSMGALFDRFFSAPNFFVSRVSDRPKAFQEKFTYGFMLSASKITTYPTEYWTLESYNWFLELRILKKMIQHYGGLLERIQDVTLPGRFHDEGIEGELLYYPYIIYTPGQFGYQIYDTIPELRKSLGVKNTFRFKHQFHHSWRSHGGYLEGLASFIDRNNAEQVTDFLKSHFMPILRVSQKIGRNRSCLDFEQQLNVIKASGTNILASSYTPELLECFLN